MLTGNNYEEINHITTMLDQHFKVKNLGDLTYFLGLEVVRNKIGIYLSSRKYTVDLLQETYMLDCAFMPTCMVHSIHLSVNQGIKLNEKTQHHIEDSLATSYILPAQD